MQIEEAQKFAASFRKQADKVLTQQWVDNWIRDLYISFEREEGTGGEIAPFIEAEEEFLRARKEGRIKIEG